MSLHEFLRLLRERWLPIVVCVVLGLAAAGISYYRTAPQYTATVTLFMSAPVPFNNPAAAYASAQVAEDRADAYTQLMNSERLADNVISSVGLDESPATLAASIGVTHQQKSVVIQASVTRNNADQAASLANAVGDAFIRLVEENEQTMDPKQPEHIDAHVVQAATPPAAPQSPKLTVNLALGLIVGLLIGIGIEFFRRILDVRIRSEQRLTEIAGVDSLGTLPYEPPVVGHPLAVVDRPQAPLAEALRKIRIKLPEPGADRGAEVIAVTSAVAGEGRTLLACNLAAAIAETGRRVLVVEADLRHPRMAEYLGLPQGPGLSEVLRDRSMEAGDTRLWRVGEVDVITSGRPEVNPSRLLSSGQMAPLLGELRREYDYVLLDTPPVLPVADAAILIPATDGVILVVRSGRTSPDDVAAAAAAIRAAGGNLLGGVLSIDRSRFRPGPRSSSKQGESQAPTKAEPMLLEGPATSVEPIASPASTVREGPAPRPEQAGPATVAVAKAARQEAGDGGVVAQAAGERVDHGALRRQAAVESPTMPMPPRTPRPPIKPRTTIKPMTTAESAKPEEAAGLDQPAKPEEPAGSQGSPQRAQTVTVAEPAGSGAAGAAVRSPDAAEADGPADSDGPPAPDSPVEAPRPRPRPRPRPVGPGSPQWESNGNGPGAALAAAPSRAFADTGHREETN